MQISSWRVFFQGSKEMPLTDTKKGTVSDLKARQENVHCLLEKANNKVCFSSFTWFSLCEFIIS